MANQLEKEAIEFQNKAYWWALAAELSSFEKGRITAQEKAKNYAHMAAWRLQLLVTAHSHLED